MYSAASEIDRVLTLLRNNIRECGHTQLDVQDALGWGRSYISQLFTKQKSLRVEQVLLILQVIDVAPADFFDQLYHRGAYARPGRSGRPRRGGWGPGEGGALEASVGDSFPESYPQLRGLVGGLLRLLVEKEVIDVDELRAAAKVADGGSALPGLGED